MADAPFIVERLNAPPFSMKLLSHRFADLKGLDLLQKVRRGAARRRAPAGDAPRVVKLPVSCTPPHSPAPRRAGV